MVELFLKGGVLMYPLLLCSIVTVAIGVERFWHFMCAGRDRASLERIHGLIENGRREEALRLAVASPGPVAAVLAEGLKHCHADAALMEEVISLKGSAELHRLNKHLHLLDLVGRIAPLLGLLGTVLGMVIAFRQVSAVKGAVDPSLLAGGIWEALLTTVAGMCVAIPALVLHHFFEDRVKSFAFLMKHYGTEAVKHLGAKA